MVFMSSLGVTYRLLTTIDPISSLCAVVCPPVMQTQGAQPAPSGAGELCEGQDGEEETPLELDEVEPGSARLTNNGGEVAPPDHACLTSNGGATKVSHGRAIVVVVL